MRRSDIRLLFLVGAFLAFAYGVYILSNDLLLSDLRVPEEILTSPSRQRNQDKIPTTIQIEKIQVNAPVLSMGLTKIGTMEAPTGPLDTGWYSLGPAPGEIGSSVIAGHRGWHTGKAVFDDLHLLEIGDEIAITEKDGSRLIFAVKSAKIYGAKDKAPEVWNKKDGRYLNLITCSGKWNRLTGTSDQRLVVFAELKL
jgi:LPXTG-site transpeptidase (sortase) family protein